MLFIYRSNLNDIAVSGAQCRLYRYRVKKRRGKTTVRLIPDPEITFPSLLSDDTTLREISARREKGSLDSRIAG